MRCDSAGFTLMEILVVMALLAAVGSFALFVSADSYRGETFRSDRAALIAALQHARAMAMHGVCAGDACTEGAPHGVAIEPDRYVLFQGSKYAARDSREDLVIPADPAVSHEGLSEVVFADASGDAQEAGDITLTDTAGHASVITIGLEGQIVWTH